MSTYTDRRRRCSVKFDAAVSTETFHQDPTGRAIGPYAHLRQELDYSYHVHYRKERQWLQDSIIEDMLDEGEAMSQGLCITPTEPWIIFTVGPKGPEKRRTIQCLVEQGKLPLLSFVWVDSDEVRHRLPEFDTFKKRNANTVNRLTRKESGYIAEILTLATLQSGRNVIVDGVMRHADWHLKLISRLRKQYPNLKIGLLHLAKKSEGAQNEESTSFEDVCEVADDEELLQSIDAVKPAVDFSCKMWNLHDEPRLKSSDGLDWETFTHTFLQSCAWKPGMYGKQKMERDVSIEESTNARLESLRQGQRSRRHFSVLISSEQNNQSDELRFYGKYSHIRRTLDYEYHGSYTFERQKLQDAIISDQLDSAFIRDLDGNIGTVPTKPWILFTAGAMGAGKSHTIMELVEKGIFPLQAFVVVDPDEIRRLLPEYHMYINENPELAGELTRKEAGFIAEVLTLAALQAGKNVLQDGSLRDAVWYKVYLQRLREEFADVRQAIIHVTAPREVVFQRAFNRSLATGRVVPREVLEAALEQVPKSVKQLSPLVNYYAEINNDQDAVDLELCKPVGSTWDDFQAQWHQSVAYLSSPKKLGKRTTK